MALQKLIAKFRTTLATGIDKTSSSMLLSSLTTDKGETIVDGESYGFIINRGFSTEETVTGTLSGSTITFITRGISDLDGKTSILSNIYDHGKGEAIEVTAHPVLIELEKMFDGGKIPSILEYTSTFALTADAQLATKKYIDDIAIAGGINASTIVKGISKLSVNPVSSTNPIAVGDNDTRVPTQDEKDALAGTGEAPDASHPFVNSVLVETHTDNTAGYLTGGTSAQSIYTYWTTITTGSFRITIDGIAYNVDGLDFSAATSMTEITSLLQTAIRTVTSGSETVVWGSDHFIFTSGITGDTSAILKLQTSTGTVGTDISGLGTNVWTDGSNGTETKGTSDYGKLVKLDEEGFIPYSIQRFTKSDYSDGDVNITSNTSLSRDMYYDTLTISNNSTLTVNGYKIFANKVFVMPGSSIQSSRVGVSFGSSGASGSTAFAPASNLSTTGHSGGSSLYAIGVSGAAGGKGGDNGDPSSGGSGGAGGVATDYSSSLSALQKYKEFAFYISGLYTFYGASGGSGSGGSGYTTTTNHVAGDGGAGGDSGGIVYIFANSIHNYGTIKSDGGDGINGGNAQLGTSGYNGSGGGGGGGGGCGGVIVLIALTLFGDGSLSVKAGSAGNGGDGELSTQTGGEGGGGGNGGNGGKIYKIYKINNSTFTEDLSYGTGGSGGTGNSGGSNGSDGSNGSIGTELSLIIY